MRFTKNTPLTVAYPGFQRGGVLKVRPDTKRGRGGGAVGFWPDMKSGRGAVDFWPDMKRAGGGGGGGVAACFSSFIVAFRCLAANY